jgi:hypothetical protein
MALPISLILLISIHGQKNSRTGAADSIEHITKRFDETTKRLLRDKNGSPLVLRSTRTSLWGYAADFSSSPGRFLSPLSGFYCDHHISVRVSKFMYGAEYLREFDPNDPEHFIQKERLCELPSGPKLLPDAFDCILAKVRPSIPSPLPSSYSLSSAATGCESEGIDRLHTQILHRADDEPIHPVRV